MAPLASPFGGEAEPWEKAMEEGPGPSEQEGDSGAGALGQVAAQCWPVLGAIFFSGTFFVLAFPFFPYVPSDGTFGQELPRVSSPCLTGLQCGGIQDDTRLTWQAGPACQGVAGSVPVTARNHCSAHGYLAQVMRTSALRGVKSAPAEIQYRFRELCTFLRLYCVSAGCVHCAGLG